MDGQSHYLHKSLLYVQYIMTTKLMGKKLYSKLKKVCGLDLNMLKKQILLKLFMYKREK